jgi:hypothetical protein
VTAAVLRRRPPPPSRYWLSEPARVTFRVERRRPGRRVRGRRVAPTPRNRRAPVCRRVSPRVALRGKQ